MAHWAPHRKEGLRLGMENGAPRRRLGADRRHVCTINERVMMKRGTNIGTGKAASRRDGDCAARSMRT